MREDLIGHLLGALEPSESHEIERALADPNRGPPLRHDLERLRRALEPLGDDRAVLPAPPGLAGRTMRFIIEQEAAASVSATRPLPLPSRLSPEESPPRGRFDRAWIDRAIVAATALAACVLVAPLLLDSIAQARARRAERNLLRTSGALQGYADAHRVFPTPPDSGPLSRAGLYAPTLVSEQRLVADDGTLLCPDTPLSRSGTFRVPTLEELTAAIGTPRFEEMVRTMGGDFGYTLGHRDASGVLQPNRDRRRRHHPLMSDAPDGGGERSGNHPDGLHHVLFEDGHVERLTPSELHRDDHLFKNHDGRIAAGVDEEDAVIGDSHHQP
ncbi:MAG: hypothetical protein EBX36_02670 [Planctomycetia bacterium]|nr:hypothetical protein [Planctomycetia bacterium]